MNKKVTLIRSRAIDPAIYKIADTLSKNDYNVKLLVWDRQKNFKNSDKEYIIHKFNLKAPYDKFHVFFYLPLWWIYIFFFLLKDDSKIMHANDLDTIIPAFLIKIIKRKKLYYTIYDFYADNLPQSTPILFKNFIAHLEKFFIGFTDFLFLVDESRYKQIEGSNIKNLQYIYNSPPDLDDIKSEYSNHSVISLFYAGVLHRTRGLEYVVRSIENVEDIKLTFAGEGLCKQWIKNKSEFENIKYIGYLSYDKVIEETMRSDILFAFYDPNIPNNKYASPNKLFEAMMCGKPIIVSDDSSMATIVRKEDCGIVIPYGNIQSVKNTILKLRDDEELRMKLGKNGRKAYENKYSWNIMEKRIIKAYSEG
jgi:glycosyltransferase involved in cell wall biosynthesis